MSGNPRLLVLRADKLNGELEPVTYSQSWASFLNLFSVTSCSAGRLALDVVLHQGNFINQGFPLLSHSLYKRQFLDIY